MHMHTWVENFTAKVSGDVMDPQKGVAKLLEFLLKDLEKGRTMPEGWDADMPAEFANDPRVVELTELNGRSEEHTSELQSLMRISYAVFCLKKKKKKQELIHNR